MMYVFAAVWTVDTKIDAKGRKENQLRNLSPRQRYATLERAVNDAWYGLLGERLDLGPVMLREGADWLYLFVAPEYTFAASDSAHAIPQMEKEQVVGCLKELSLRTPNLVLVPGTIAWKKPVVRTGAQVYKRGTMTPKQKGRDEKFFERIRSSYEAELKLVPHKLDQFIKGKIQQDESSRERFESGEYRKIMGESFAQEVVGTYDDRRLKMVANLEKAKELCSIARNTAYGFYKGKEVARYHKRGDYFEVLHSESDGGFVIYEPGGGPEGPGDRFQVENVRFGIEVCLDHQIGFLSQGKGEFPHIQIIMSAETPLVNEHTYVVDGGYIVHASSNWDFAGMSQKVSGHVAPMKMKYKSTSIGELRLATLPVEVA